MSACEEVTQLPRKESSDAWVCAAALSELDFVGPAHLTSLMEVGGNDATATWSELLKGESAPAQFHRTVRRRSDCVAGVELWRHWVAQARKVDLSEVRKRYVHFGVAVTTRGEVGYPSVLAQDEYAPAVLFTLGDVTICDQPTVAIVGTRRCSTTGKVIAEGFGRALADAGVAVVSGLALGIDGAAHEGALRSMRQAGSVGPVGVVGSGLNVVYPATHRALWHSVADRGVLMSEAPLSGRPEKWRFPARNRIIAALADVVLVVETHDRGGSLLTVEEGLARGKTIMAVPGSICSPASRGVNALLREGAIPACTPENVLEELMTLVRGSSMEFGSDVGGVPGAGGVPGVGDVPNVSTQTLHVRDGRQQARREALLNAEEKAVLAAVEWEPTATDDVLLRTGLPLGTVAMSLMALERGGFLHGHEGRWWRSE